VFGSICTDTRSLQRGALFVALVGERFDGHDYLAEACRRGATGAVVRSGAPKIPGLISYEVQDTTEALGMLARERRREIAGPVVAVTGTNGKTATKEMLACALRVRWSVHATHENRNNLIGVPLTILDAPSDCDALVVEVGANELGEIARLRDVVEPSVGIVTNVSLGHLDGFGSFEGVMREKTSLLSGVELAVVGTDPPSLDSWARQQAARVVTAGLDEGASFTPDRWKLDDKVQGTIWLDGIEVRLPVVGYHQIENLMLVLAVARELDLDLSAVATALEDVRLPPGRCEVLTYDKRTILQDAYNSNPGSLRALLKTAAAMRKERPLIVVLGSMLELGGDSASLHAEMADCVMKSNPHIVAVSNVLRMCSTTA
jgi:UDP-N-acetylmuramoyl-tripeptide--D-alanyl-D-alanine ligase